MNFKIYQIDVFSITIVYIGNEIIINIINEKKNIYEIIINDINLKNICFFNLNLNDVEEYYNFIIEAFENLEKYEIFISLSNNNNKFIRLIIKKTIINDILNIIWIKNKKEYSYNDEETIILNEQYFLENSNIKKRKDTMMIYKNVENKKSIYNFFISIYNFFNK